MSPVPNTSTTLLRDIGANTNSAGWREFVSRYRPMMEAFLRARFPGLDAEDLVQETFLALLEKLPDYRYRPEESGHFRNYLVGILRHKALSALRRLSHTPIPVGATADFQSAADATADEAASEAELREWRHSAYELALGQLLADPSIQDRTKQIFLRTAVNGEPPEDVAKAFGIGRNSVDQMKSRMIQKLRGIVASLEALRED